jgi:lipopolysaccharide/colanic/teichoic acid biosynthesis glycosyltransferase
MKRVFDFSLSLVVLVVLCPLLLGIAALVRFRLGAPAFFSQLRPGRGGRTFTLLKFRTMTDACDARGKLLSDAERLTPFGRWLREMSLDELPELWNVLRGEMSLVGPRPLLVEYLGRYTPTEARRHEVRPGLTGWAQVNGRNATTWEKRLALDVWYVDHRSFWLDLRILVLTVVSVLRREGISAPGVATMTEFRPPADQTRRISTSGS